ncbi:MAG: diaminopimelate epimerase, partial [Verrucomicrobiota bacterium]|nr:diaminopimelate epimerase [Verrucomicrobiota bacterium]
MSFLFYKMHGSGNDFILIDDRRKKFPLKDISLIKNLTSRSEGIGSDGLILLQDSKDCDLKMRFFNPDGLEQDMCGNGL